MKLSGFGAFLAGLYLISFAAIGVVLWHGLAFYATPLAERAHDPGYWLWKAGGTIGQPLGIIGSSMMVVMLLYSARKRIKALRGFGSLSRWLDVHIYLGLVGPLLVTLHSAFKVSGLVALSFWSMIAVVVSGILGRYIYLQIPRTRAGDEVSLAELEAADRALSERLRLQFHLDPARLARLEALSAPPPAGGGVLRHLMAMAMDGLRYRRLLREFLRNMPTAQSGLLREFRSVVRQKALLHRRILLLDRVHELFHYWHVVHKPFAIVMYVFMVVHIVVAIATGYGRIGLR